MLQDLFKWKFIKMTKGFQRTPMIMAFAPGASLSLETQMNFFSSQFTQNSTLTFLNRKHHSLRTDPLCLDCSAPTSDLTSASWEMKYKQMYFAELRLFLKVRDNERCMSSQFFCPQFNTSSNTVIMLIFKAEATIIFLIY